jgi:hypothetical protein
MVAMANLAARRYGSVSRARDRTAMWARTPAPGPLNPVACLETWGAYGADPPQSPVIRYTPNGRGSA